MKQILVGTAPSFGLFEIAPESTVCCSVVLGPDRDLGRPRPLLDKARHGRIAGRRLDRDQRLEPTPRAVGRAAGDLLPGDARF
jgi:hypothetical protein